MDRLVAYLLAMKDIDTVCVGRCGVDDEELEEIREWCEENGVELIVSPVDTTNRG